MSCFHTYIAFVFIYEWICSQNVPCLVYAVWWICLQLEEKQPFVFTILDYCIITTTWFWPFLQMCLVFRVCCLAQRHLLCCFITSSFITLMLRDMRLVLLAFFSYSQHRLFHFILKSSTWLNAEELQLPWNIYDLVIK